MYICYIDEAGCTGQLPTSVSDIQPTFSLLGLIVHTESVNPLTHDFLLLKQKYYPGALARSAPSDTAGHYLDAIRFEVKGSELRKEATSRRRRIRRHAIRVLDAIADLVREHHCRVIGQVLVKGVGIPIKSRAVYTSYVQTVCDGFQNFLATEGDTGAMIGDFRNPNLNAVVSHSIFTRKHSARGDAYPNLLEMPTFGHSDNHAGLQLADLLASAHLTPGIIDFFCQGMLTSVHCRTGYDRLRRRYTNPLRRLQYIYQADTGRWSGGIQINDRLTGRHARDFFSAPDL